MSNKPNTFPLDKQWKERKRRLMEAEQLEIRSLQLRKVTVNCHYTRTVIIRKIECLSLTMECCTTIAKKKKLRKQLKKLDIQAERLQRKEINARRKSQMLHQRSVNVIVEAKDAWIREVRKYYGAGVLIQWRTWNESNTPVCHIKKHVYV